MRLGIILACVFALYALGIVAAAGPWPGNETLLVASRIFFSSMIGMLVARLTERSQQYEAQAVTLANANIALEAQVFARTAALRDKIKELELAREEAIDA